MFKRIALALMLVLFTAGCSINVNERLQHVDSDFETLADGTIILSGGVDEDTYKEFYRATSVGKKEYTLLIMTKGGCAFNTVAIMNRIEILQAEGVRFKMIVPGNGFSAGSYIFMMGDERIMYRGAQLMWHTITGQMKSVGRVIPEESRQMSLNLDMYVVEKFEELFPYITKEWIHHAFWNSGMTWMTSEQALLMGIATKIIN